MDPLLIGELSIVFLFLLLFLRVHVGIALYSTGFFGYWAMVGNLQDAIRILSTLPYAVTASFTLATLPLFMLMGVYAGLSGFAADAYQAARTWMSRLPGGLAIATTVANAIFGAACGTTVAAVAVFTQFSLPEMKRSGYQPAFACAAIASAGAIAMLIPPSVIMVFYGMLTELSIGKLFIAGIGPGLLLTATLAIGILVMVKLKPALAAKMTASFSWRDRLLAIRKVWGIVILAVLVMGGIYSGVFTPEEAGAAGAFAALIIALIMRRVNMGAIGATLRDASRVQATIFLIFTGAMLYSRMIALSGLPVSLANWIHSAQIPPMGLMAVFVVLYLALGCILDSMSMLTLTLPIVYPMSVQVGWDPIWFAIIVIMTVECGLLTPPVGLSIFVAKAVAGPEVTLEELFRAVTPFFLITLLTVVIIIAFPPIVTWLPGLMMK